MSIPKSGRTWLRVFLYSYFCALENRPFTLKKNELEGGKIPKLMFTHDLWGYLTARKLRDRLSGKHLIPPVQSREKPIVLLSRDPRDVIVSLFFQLSKRDHRYDGALSEMIRHPKFGIELIIDVMNIWMAEWGDRSDFKLLRYEDCRKNNEKTFREVLAFFGLQEVDDAILAHSLKFASFENMKTLEAIGQVKEKKLLPGNVHDPESFKVRRGVVGGYRDYLSSEDVLYLEGAVARLDRRYGYGRETWASANG